MGYKACKFMVYLGIILPTNLVYARFTSNRDQLRTDLRVEKIWISWTREQSLNLLSLDHKLAFTSMLGSDWHTSKQKVHNWPSNKSDLRPHHDRLASSRPSHAIRKFIGINSGPRTKTMARPLWYTCDWPPTDLWCFATDWRPTHDLGTTALSFLSDSSKVCMRWKYQEWLATDLRSCRMTYEAIEWFTTKTCDQRGIQLRVGSLTSEIDKFHDRFWQLKVVVELVDFNGK